jgi:hypothetical protein
MTPLEKALAKIGYVLIVSTGAGFVAMSVVKKKEFDGLPEKFQARFIRIMEMWTERHALTKEQFNGNEGRAQRGDLNELIQAFKAFKVRLYGSVFEFQGLRGFFIVEIDTNKKQNKADPKVLKRAKDLTLDLVSELRPQVPSKK